MNFQNLFYATSSITVIIIGIIIIAFAIVALIIAIRLAKFSHQLSSCSNKLENFLKNLKDKLHYSTIIALIIKFLKEAISLIKNKKDKKDKDK